MIYLPKNIRAAKTLKTFLKRLGEYCLSHANKDITVLRHFLQVYLEISRIRAFPIREILRMLAEVKDVSMEETYEAFYKLQREFTDDEHRVFMSYVFNDYSNDSLAHIARESFKQNPDYASLLGVKALFFIDPRGKYRGVDAKFMIEFASKYLLLYAGDINDDLVLIKSSVIMEHDVDFIRGAQ